MISHRTLLRLLGPCLALLLLALAPAGAAGKPIDGWLVGAVEGPAKFGVLGKTATPERVPAPDLAAGLDADDDSDQRPGSNPRLGVTVVWRVAPRAPCPYRIPAPFQRFAAAPPTGPPHT